MARSAASARAHIGQKTVSQILGLIPNILVWLEADSGVTMDVSNRVSQWNDQTANGGNAVQATSGIQPLYVASSINSLPAIRFTSARNDYMTLTTTLASAGSAHSLFAVFKENAAGPSSFNGVIGFGSSVVGQSTSIIGQDNTNSLWFGGAGVGVPTLGVLSNGQVVMAAKTTSANNPSVDTIWRNGVKYKSVKQLGNYAINPLTDGILGRYFSTSGTGNHDIALAIWASREFSDREMEILNAYAGKKYGIGTHARSAASARLAASARSAA